MMGTFGGLNLVQVEAGTKIRDPRTGEEMEVRDDNAVRLGGTLYVTTPNFDRLRDRVKPNASQWQGDHSKRFFDPR